MLGQEGNQRDRAKQRLAHAAYALLTKINKARLVASPKTKQSWPKGIRVYCLGNKG
jgi:hypothetical protein